MDYLHRIIRKEIIKRNIMNRKDNSTQLSDDIMSGSVNLITLGYIIRYFFKALRKVNGGGGENGILPLLLMR